MQYINPDVATICTGMAASRSCPALCGAAGKRTGLKHSRVMIHQPLGGARRGCVSSIEITAREIQKLKKVSTPSSRASYSADHDKVWEDSDRDYWMIASEAKEYGMIDEVLEKKG